MRFILNFLGVYYPKTYLLASETIESYYFDKRSLDDEDLKKVFAKIVVFGGILGFMLSNFFGQSITIFYATIVLYGLTFLIPKELLFKRIKSIINYSLGAYSIIGVGYFMLSSNGYVDFKTVISFLENTPNIYLVLFFPFLLIVFNLVGYASSNLLTKLFKLHLNHCVSISEKNENTNPIKVASLHYDILIGIIILSLFLS